MDVSSRDRPTLTASVEGVRYTSLIATISHDNNDHRTSKHASTNWRSDGSPSCLGSSHESTAHPCPLRWGSCGLLTNSTTHNNGHKKMVHNDKRKRKMREKKGKQKGRKEEGKKGRREEGKKGRREERKKGKKEERKKGRKEERKKGVQTCGRVSERVRVCTRCGAVSHAAVSCHVSVGLSFFSVRGAVWRRVCGRSPPPTVYLEPTQFCTPGRRSGRWRTFGRRQVQTSLSGLLSLSCVHVLCVRETCRVQTCGRVSERVRVCTGCGAVSHAAVSCHVSVGLSFF